MPCSRASAVEGSDSELPDTDRVCRVVFNRIRPSAVNISRVFVDKEVKMHFLEDRFRASHSEASLFQVELIPGRLAPGGWRGGSPSRARPQRGVQTSVTPGWLCSLRLHQL